MKRGQYWTKNQRFKWSTSNVDFSKQHVKIYLGVTGEEGEREFHLELLRFRFELLFLNYYSYITAGIPRNAHN